MWYVSQKRMNCNLNPKLTSCCKLAFRQDRQCKIKHQLAYVSLLIMLLITQQCHPCTILGCANMGCIEYKRLRLTANYKLQNINKTQTFIFAHSHLRTVQIWLAIMFYFIKFCLKVLYSITWIRACSISGFNCSKSWFSSPQHFIFYPH